MPAIVFAVVLLGIPTVASTEPCDAAPPREAQEVATRVAALIEREPLSVASLMHYPPAQTAPQRQADVAGVERTIGFLIEQFGAASSVRPVTEQVVFFEVGGGGGDLHYWDSLSPLETFDFIYSARFSKLGRGVIKIRIVRHRTLKEVAVQAIGFGLLATRTDARSEMARVVKGMMLPGNYVKSPAHTAYALRRRRAAPLILRAPRRDALHHVGGHYCPGEARARPQSRIRTQSRRTAWNGPRAAPSGKNAKRAG